MGQTDCGDQRRLFPSVRSSLLTSRKVAYPFETFGYDDANFFIHPEHWHMVARLSKNADGSVSPPPRYLTSSETGFYVLPLLKFQIADAISLRTAGLVAMQLWRDWWPE